MYQTTRLIQKNSEKKEEEITKGEARQEIRFNLDYQGQYD